MKTQIIPLSDDRWTKLGQGPALVAAYGSEILFSIGDKPDKEVGGFMLRFDQAPLWIDLKEVLWAKAVFMARTSKVVIAFKPRKPQTARA